MLVHGYGTKRSLVAYLVDWGLPTKCAFSTKPSQKSYYIKWYLLKFQLYVSMLYYFFKN